MTTRLIKRLSLSVTLAVAVSAEVFAAAIVPSSGTVTPGVWNSNLEACKSYAQANGLPLVAVWSKEGCHFCAQFEPIIQTDTFAKWCGSVKPVLFYVHAPDYAGSYAVSADWIRENKWTGFPFVRVWWPAANKNLSFMGRFSAIGIESADKTNDQRALKLIRKLETVIGDWKYDESEQEPTPPDQPPPTSDDPTPPDQPPPTSDDPTPPDQPPPADTKPSFAEASYSYGVYSGFDVSESLEVINVSKRPTIVRTGKLPTGLKLAWDSKTSKFVLSGKARKAGKFEVGAKLRVGRESGDRVTTITIEVKDPASINAYATKDRSQTIPLFGKTAERDEVLAGILTVSIRKTGIITANYQGTENRKVAFKGAWSAIDPETKIVRAELEERRGARVILELASNGELAVTAAGVESFYKPFEDKMFTGSAKLPLSNVTDLVGNYSMDLQDSGDQRYGIALVVTKASARKGLANISISGPSRLNLRGTVQLLSGSDGATLVPVFVRNSKNVFSALLVLTAEKTLDVDQEVKGCILLRQRNSVTPVILSPMEQAE